jgi:amidohydrolase
MAAIAIDDLLPDLIALRRDLHAHPELAFEERRTADIVAAALRELGLEVHEGLAGTGVVGTLRHGRSMRTIGLRADMDALPIVEQSELPHASRHAGVHHGCGHDGHTTMLLGAARQLATRSSSWIRSTKTLVVGWRRGPRSSMPRCGAHALSC